MKNNELNDNKSIYNVKVKYDELFNMFIDTNNYSSSEYREKINILTGKEFFNKKENTWIDNPYVIYVREISGAYIIANKEIVINKKALEILDKKNVTEKTNKNGDKYFKVNAIYNTLNSRIRELKGDIDNFNNNLIDEEKTQEEKRKLQKEIDLIKNELEEINCFHEPFYELYIQENKKRYKSNIKLKDSKKKNNVEPCKEITPLVKKINWIAGGDLLRTHIEKLKEINFIDYGNDSIDKVMSGDEIGVFIKHKLYKSINHNILALYELWNDKNYITGYIIEKQKNGEKYLERQYTEFMKDVFNCQDKEDIEPKSISPGSMGTIQNRESKKIEEVKKYLNSILIA